MAKNIPKLIMLNDVQIREIIKPNDIFSILKQCIIDFSKHDETVVQPLRSRLVLDDPFNIFLTMPVFHSQRSLGIKLLTMFPKNKDLPIINGSIILFNHITGITEAMFEAGYITALRTSVVSAIATEYLAVENAKILSIIGTGFEAEHHIDSHISLKSWDIIHIIGSGYEKAQYFANRMMKKYPGQVFRAASDKKLALLESDVVCTVTTSKVPVLSYDMLKPHCHINCVGAPSPNETELDKETMLKAKVVTDSIEAAYIESGDVILSGAKVICELGSLLTNPSKYGISRSELTVFKSLGMAIEDICVAKFALDKYIKTTGDN